MKKCIHLILFLAAVTLLGAGCATDLKAWEDPETAKDCAILYKVKVNVDHPSFITFTRAVLLIKQLGAKKDLEFHVDLENKDNFPNNPLLLKVKPGKYDIWAAVCYMYGPGYPNVKVRPEFKKRHWAEVKAGEVVVGGDIEFYTNCKDLGGSLSSNYTTVRRFGEKNFIAVIDDALLCIVDDHPWRKKLLKAKKKLEASIRERKKALEKPQDKPEEKPEEKP
ncbi:MAG: hypothetical protein E3J72_15010 [Planctomycetota bacterium]|nr:MAG: hypothetical protein E3J72_15010 [Planctomycetota bacterium]